LDVDRDGALWEWVSRPPEHGEALLFDYLRGVEGSCSIAPVSDEVVRRYINGTVERSYAFALQIILPMSDTNDNQNISNMVFTRTWQRWVKQQAKSGSFPDFGEQCSNYRLVSETAPTLTQMYDNNLAKYSFYATIKYREEAS